MCQPVWGILNQTRERARMCLEGSQRSCLPPHFWLRYLAPKSFSRGNPGICSGLWCLPTVGSPLAGICPATMHQPKLEQVCVLGEKRRRCSEQMERFEAIPAADKSPRHWSLQVGLPPALQILKAVSSKPRVSNLCFQRNILVFSTDPWELTARACLAADGRCLDKAPCLSTVLGWCLLVWFEQTLGVCMLSEGSELLWDFCFPTPPLIITQFLPYVPRSSVL